jgi:predicted nucleotidyltransferase
LVRFRQKDDDELTYDTNIVEMALTPFRIAGSILSYGGDVMNHKSLVSLVTTRREEIVRRFAIKKLGVFGSAARDQMHEGSDIDVLVEFQASPTFDASMDLQFYLEDLFHASVDVVIEDTVKSRMRPFIEKDLIRVA